MEARAWPRLRGNWGAEESLLFNRTTWLEWNDSLKPPFAEWSATRKAPRWWPKKRPYPKPHHVGQGCKGLWNQGVKGTRGATPKPGSMSEYIRQRGLLPASEVDRIFLQFPSSITSHMNQWAAAIREWGRRSATGQLDDWDSFLAEFFHENAEAQLELHLCAA
ncbi:hypothetical protein [uncultured Demequina sp.]|uniref:hypothetical protein n=1 Tax=uncultured Demequina sp. TaxID=693499 RepID=UPI0025CBE270|nr:hypothetical protein [uncultured Demequina sp.]